MVPSSPDGDPPGERRNGYRPMKALTSMRIASAPFPSGPRGRRGARRGSCPPERFPPRSPPAPRRCPPLPPPPLGGGGGGGGRGVEAARRKDPPRFPPPPPLALLRGPEGKGA